MICCSQIILPEPLTEKSYPDLASSQTRAGSCPRRGRAEGQVHSLGLSCPPCMGDGFPVDFSNVSLLLPEQAKISAPPLGGLEARGWAEEAARGGSADGLAVEEGAAAVRVKELRGEKTAGCQKRKWICWRVWRKDILILIHCLFKCWINMEVHSCQEQYVCQFCSIL